MHALAIPTAIAPAMQLQSDLHRSGYVLISIIHVYSNILIAVARVEDSASRRPHGPRFSAVPYPHARTLLFNPCPHIVYPTAYA